MENRIWILPKNDLESVEIANMLENSEEKYFITNQGWGASWGNLESKLIEDLKPFINQDTLIYGIELIGKCPFSNFINIDHHIFVEDRYKPESSIEQVANILGIELNQRQNFIARNDAEYIPGMIKYGKSLGMSDKEIDEIVKEIRAEERAISRKVTPEQEQESQRALEEMEFNKDLNLCVVRQSHSEPSPICDALFGKCENLLFICDDGNILFYGKETLSRKLYAELGGYTSEDMESNGFYIKEGVKNPNSFGRKAINIIKKELVSHPDDNLF